MRIVLQRVSEARVKVNSETVGAIAHGWLALVGIAPDDTVAITHKLAEKVAHLRAFNDDAGKMNRSVLDVAGSVLVVSQFTLHGDCSKGRRPSFIAAARPEHAEPLVAAFVTGLRLIGLPVATGVFAADMKVELVNDGPVTLLLDSVDITGTSQ